jgi:hypothetical protein
MVIESSFFLYDARLRTGPALKWTPELVKMYLWAIYHWMHDLIERIRRAASEVVHPIGARTAS